MPHYIFQIKTTLQEALAELETHPLENLYVIEDPIHNNHQIGAWTTQLPTLTHSTPVLKDDAIDWSAQWATHVPNYQDGRLKITLPNHTFHLLPGEGFGDLSHPTTQLMLDLMSHYVTNRPVIDIGCGSGILAIAAHFLGASTVQGIDIDPKALRHAQINAELNQLSIPFTHSLPSQFPSNPVFLINMITSEQAPIWAQFTSRSSLPATYIVSGILDTQIDYINSLPLDAYQIFQEKSSDGWRACVIQTP